MRPLASRATELREHDNGDRGVVHTRSPLVIGHRGASGYRPEHTLASFELAARMGADYIEPDVVSTKDHVLVVRHENELSQTTDVADHPEFTSRRTTKCIDGRDVSGWFTEDFTAAELSTLRARERLPLVRQRSTLYDGRWRIPTLDEVFALRERLSEQLGRTVGVIPEIKHPTYFRTSGLPLEGPIAATIRAYQLDSATAPVAVQSFELGALVELRQRLGVQVQQLLLTLPSGMGLADSGRDARLLTPAGLADIARWVDIIGPEKSQVIPRTSSGALGTPTSLVRDAHQAGLLVMPYTFRAENHFLPANFASGQRPDDYGRAIDESLAFMRAGVDGLFCDQPDVCVEARREFLAGGPQRLAG